MSELISILMVGVGGQGILLASNVLCAAALNAGYDVKKSEIHGMAQRGGSVVSHVRIGKKVSSPVIPVKGADIILSFEKMEFTRYIEYTNEKTVLVVNKKKILPPTVASGAALYPDNEISDLYKKFNKVLAVDADKISQEAGNIKASGLVVLGKMSALVGIDQKSWEKAIAENVPQKTVQVNATAFCKGQSVI